MTEKVNLPSRPKHVLCRSNGKVCLLQPPKELPQSPHVVFPDWSVDQQAVYLVPLTSIFTARFRVAPESNIPNISSGIRSKGPWSQALSSRCLLDDEVYASSHCSPLFLRST
ncbi:hypothetical protein PoB_004035400 [Plakobranchus ocellatus]|uniref:Uncharacterized protein n=1 Tax=Plakobranchus ocellatus TaxID=259542 RepID=A0AAV4B1G0_9GAST|nr:hypothetical protein PoB_004035400 [Plakobranchus ocellatus]